MYNSRMTRVMRIWSLHIFISLISSCISSKLNVPRVLLPYNQDNPSNFTLKVQEGGCYTWSSSRNIVSISEVSPVDQCSTEIVVTAITRSPNRQTAIILAKDQETGVSLRCDIIIDSIHRLEIITTTRELFVEEAPEEFEVRAYDDQGNEFSSLEGQHFTWNIQSLSETNESGSAQNVLRFISFESSPYEAPHAIAPLEERGFQGYMVLVEGQQTGLAKLSVRLENLLYQSVAPATVELMVVANLMLEPQDIYILPHTAVEYSVFHLKHGIFHPVTVQGSQYSIQVDRQSVGQTENDGITVTGVGLGSTLVKLQDTNVKSSQNLKEPTATLHVVDPAQLTISVVPFNNPNLIKNKPYVFLVHLFDANGNKILVTDDFRVSMNIPGEYFSTELMSKNGTYWSGVPIRAGSTQITAVLSAVERNGNMNIIVPPVKASLALKISDLIKVVPAVTVLPWNPVTKPTYNLTFIADKASGAVTWSSSKPNVAQILQSGACQTKGMGKAIITASLKSNPHNKDTGEVHIREATKLALIPGVFETEVGKLLPLHISLSSILEGMEVSFSSCFNIPYSVESSDGIFVPSKEIWAPKEHLSCASTDVVAQAQGFSVVSVSYESSNGKLTAETPVAAYNPLKPIQPVSGETTLVPDSSRILLFEGGPLLWHTASHFVDVSVSNMDIGTAKIFRNMSSPKTKSDIYAVEVLCTQIGELRVSLTVGNRPASSLPFPQKSTAFVDVVCSLPDSILLKKPSAPSMLCPSVAELGYTIAHCEQELPLEIVVSDSAGRTFDNISSLSFEWRISNSKISSLPEKGMTFFRTHHVHGFTMPLNSGSVLSSKGIPGDVEINVKMSGGDDFEISPTRAEATMLVHLVQEATIEPKNLVLFNDANSGATASVYGGSGFFYLEQSGIKKVSNVADVEYLQEQKELKIRPISDGNSTVTLLDACLDHQKSFLNVKVSSIALIEVSVVERVQVQNSIIAEVVVIDTDGVVVPVHHSMMLTPHIDDSKLLSKVDQITADGVVRYEIKGKEIGDSCIKFSTKKSPKSNSLIYSKCEPVQVFPPLTLEPKHLTMLVGSSYQVKALGGPYPDINIEYSVDNKTVMTTSHSGILTALALGATRLTAKAISPGSNGGNTIVYSQDTVIIEVIPLTRIYIHSPLTSIEVGSIMPLYAMGPKRKLNPMSYASAEPVLLFDWSISNKAIVSLEKPYSENGIEETSENGCIIRLKARKAGRVSIKLKVSVMVPQPNESFQLLENTVLEDTVEIKVFDSLRLISPYTDDAKLLITPNSRIPLATNLKHDGDLTYVVEKSSSSFITVTSEGLVEAGGTSGHATIVITRTEPAGVQQRLAVLVEVMPVNYIMTTPEVFMKVKHGQEVQKVPIGSSHALQITFHDSRGRIFDAVQANLRYRPSRFDLVNVQQGAANDSVTMTVRASGTTVLHVTDDSNPHIDDYLKLSSGQVIKLEQESIGVGEQLCPQNFVEGVKTEKSLWKTDSSSIAIDASTGMTTGLRPGKANIFNEFSSSFSTSAELSVLPLKRIVIEPPSTVMSNTDVGRRIFVPVLISSMKSDLEWKPCSSTPEGTFHDIQCNNSVCFPQGMPDVNPFVCRVDFVTPIEGLNIKDFLSASLIFHPKQGYACAITSIAGPLPMTSKLPLKVFVEAVSTGSLYNEVRSGKVPILFYSAAVIDKDEVHITDQDPAAEIFVTGIPQVLASMVVAEESNLVKLVIEKVNEYSCKVVISARDVAWTGSVPLISSPVSIYSPVNMQTIEIKVSLEQLGPGVCTDPGRQVGFLGLILAIVIHYQSVLVSTICVGLTIAFMLFAYRSLVGPGYKQSGQDGVFANSKPTKTNPLAALNQTTTSNKNTGGANNSFISQTPVSQSLWSVDRDPIYGDPLFRSSPLPAYDSSPVYRRNSP